MRLRFNPYHNKYKTNGCHDIINMAAAYYFVLIMLNAKFFSRPQTVYHHCYLLIAICPLLRGGLVSKLLFLRRGSQLELFRFFVWIMDNDRLAQLFNGFARDFDGLYRVV